MGVLDPPAAPLTQFRRVQARQIVPVATRAAPSFGINNPNTGLSDGTVLGGTARLQHKALVTAHGLVLAFGNFYNNSSGVETDGPNDITVEAAVEAFNGQKVAVYFNGAKSVTIKPGGIAYSDPIGVSVPKGTLFWTDTYVSIASGNFPQGSPTTVSANGEAHNYANPAGANLTTTGSAAVSGTTNTRAYGPAAIFGLPKTAGFDVVGFGGDSIVAGTGDAGSWLDGGWGERWLNNAYPFQKIAYPSEIVDAWYASGGILKRRGRAILEKAGPTFYVNALGVNGLSAGLATWQSHMIGDGIRGSWSTLATFGVPVYQPTITPQTTTTDGWATTANQTLTNSGNETTRLAINAWLRDGAPISAAPSAGGVAVAVGGTGIRAGQTGHPLAGILEVAWAIESAHDSGKFPAGVSYAVTAASTATNVVTVTTATPHGLAVNDKVSIVGVDAAINSSTTTYSVVSVPTSTSFTFSKTTANATYTAQGNVVVPYTSDGTHPSSMGHALIAATLPTPASLGLVAAA